MIRLTAWWTTGRATARFSSAPLGLAGRFIVRVFCDCRFSDRDNFVVRDGGINFLEHIPDHLAAGLIINGQQSWRIYRVRQNHILAWL
ncbi:MAG: hypothetical protein NG747_05035 [Candidatus Brocadia sp.]|nr:hypothetical protein [Candidatus Brocadia sp.]